MMPQCTGGLIGCTKTAVFLGPYETPALCEEHFRDLLMRVHAFLKKNVKTSENPLDQTPNASFEIENAQVEGVLNDIGQQLGSKMPEGFGFNLLIFSFGKDGSMFYISNAQRQDMVKAMREFTEKQEAA